MYKEIIIFIIGLFEQLLYTKYILSVDKRQTIVSTIYMVAYMAIYLSILDYAIKDTNTISLLISYALACGFGNYIAMKWEVRNKKR